MRQHNDWDRYHAIDTLTRRMDFGGARLVALDEDLGARQGAVIQPSSKPTSVRAHNAARQKHRRAAAIRAHAFQALAEVQQRARSARRRARGRGVGVAECVWGVGERGG